MNKIDQALDQILRKLSLKLPPAPKPVGAYRPMVAYGDIAYLSGQISKDAEGRVIAGKVGKELTLEEGKQAAQCAMLQAISLIHSEIGLRRIDQVLRVVGYVHSAENFFFQSDVMNAASELLVDLLGEKGRHARTSIGVTSLPLNAAVEIELTLRLV